MVIGKLRLSENEKKQLLAKTESSIITNRSRPTDMAEHNLPQAWVISEIQVYEIWNELGKELFNWGEVYRAKEFLNEAYKHAKVV